MDLFPALPESLPTESAALAALLEELKSRLAEVLAASKPGATPEQREIIGDLTTEDILAQFATATVQIAEIETTLSETIAAEELFVKTLTDGAASVGVLDTAEEIVAEAAEDFAAEAEEPSDDDDAAEAVIADEVAILASADTKTIVPRRPPPAASKDHQPIENVLPGAALVASLGIDGVEGGASLNRLELASAIMRARRQYTSAPAGFEEKAVVATASWNLPPERVLDGVDMMTDWGKIEAVRGPGAWGATPEGVPALVASGGLCAPVNNYYELQMLSTAERPVRAGLVGFQATRGGINAAMPPTLLSGVDTAVGYKTEAQDGGGGTLANKTCQTIPCPTFHEVDIEMIYHCITVGNMVSRTFPEQVAQFQDLVMAAHSRLAEGLLLNALAAGSTAVTQAAVNGSVSTLLGGILQATAGFRSRHRTSPDLRLRAIFPAWVLQHLVLDLVRQQFDRFSRDEAGVVALLRMCGIEPSFTLDSETGGGMVFGAQNAGALLEFPDTVKWFLYPEGGWLYLDGGVLELGIVRDSTLNSTNDYTIFGETFEAAAGVGIESLYITTTFCPNGQTAVPGTALTC